MKDVKVTGLRQKLHKYPAKVRRGERLRVTSRGQVIAEIASPAAARAEAAAARARQRAALRAAARSGDRPGRVGREQVIVLDTHALVLWVADAARFSIRAKRAASATVD